MGRSSQQILQTIVKGVPFYVDGRTGYTDARDVAHAMIELTLAEKWGERYIIVGHNSSVRDLQVLFAKALETKAPSIKAGHNLIMCAAYLTEAWNKITGSRCPLTVESSRSMGGENYYSSEKLLETINIQFTPLEESVRNMVSFYKYNKNITHEQ
jgi:nucleoside-diphosphate-sugar epimerase